MFWTLSTFNPTKYCNFLSNTWCSEAESLITIYGVREANSKFFHIDAYWVPLTDAAAKKKPSNFSVVLDIPLKQGRIVLHLEPIHATGGLNATHKSRIQAGLCVGIPSNRLAVTESNDDDTVKLTIFFKCRVID